MRFATRQRQRRQRGLTLLEILLAMAILGIVLLAIAATMSSMQNLWMKVRGKVDQYRNSRQAIDTMASRIASATLASRWEPDPEATASDDKFVRASDLHFVCGPADEVLSSGTYSGSAIFFQAPFGERSVDSSIDDYSALHQAMCAWGYFVEFGTDAPERPRFLHGHQDLAPEKLRFRLMEFREPAHELPIFQEDNSGKDKPVLADASTQTKLYDWFRKPLQANNNRDRHVSMIAENIIAMLLTVIDPDETSQTLLSGSDGVYDSRRFQWQPKRALAESMRHRLPPVMQLTVIATSEDAWARMTDDQISLKASELRSLFRGRFKDDKAIQDDLKLVEDELTKQKFPHQIITLKVPMKR